MAAIAGDHAGRPYFSGTRTQPGETFAPTVIELPGWRIGYLAVTQHANQIRGAAQFVDIVDYDDTTQVEDLLDRVRRLAAQLDLLILSYHGGIELAVEQQQRKLQFFLRLIEAGVDMVHGHHPHVLQPIVTAARDGERKRIMPSTGNLISGMSMPVAAANPRDPRAFAGDSALFRVTVERGRSGANVAAVAQLLVTNYRDRSGRMVIGRQPQIAVRAWPPWRAYFETRLELMRAKFCPPCDLRPGTSRWWRVSVGGC